jgi:type I restriction enzyme S subunit
MKTVALGKVAKIDRTVANDNECLSLPYVGLEHVEKERGHFADGFVPTPLNMLATNFRFTPKHVLYGKLRPYLNKVVLPSFDGVCTTEILPILPNEEKLDRTFLWAVLLSPTFVNWATSQISGANLPRLDPKLLVEYEIPLPPLTEQKRIASLLARADRLRQLRRTAHDLGDALLQSVFLEMFGDPVTNSKKLNVEKLEGFTSLVSSGSTPLGGSNVYTASGIRFIRSQNVLMNKFDFSDIAFISEEIYASMRRTVVKPNDVLLNITGASIGRVACYQDDILANVNQHVCIIRCKPEKLNPIYLSYFLSMPSFQEKFITNQSGATRQALNFEQIKDFNIPVPPLSLQEEFAGVVARVESLRGRMGESTRQVEGLFESLLAEAFWRLVITNTT